jgi:hypothetical protein
MRIHRERAQRSTDLSQMDPSTDWHEIYRRLTLWELPSEARFGFQLAFYRPFAVPRMAAVLESTGHFRRDTTRRAYDTGLVMHEIIWGGVDSERGERMVRLMNALHRRPDIHAEDMTYILNALIVVPTRFMNRYGWRKVTDSEQTATWRFYHVLGERMGIACRPSSYGDAERWLVQYEARHLQPSPEGTALTAAVLRTLRDRLPRLARPFAAQITSALVGDPAVSRALSLPPPNSALCRVLEVGAGGRRLFERLRPPPRQPSFWPGRPAGAVYPQGYTLDQLGPREQ